MELSSWIISELFLDLLIDFKLFGSHPYDLGLHVTYVPGNGARHLGLKKHLNESDNLADSLRLEW